MVEYALEPAAPLRALVVWRGMAKQQSRRSISINAPLYDRLKAWCLEHNRSMSSVVEECVGEFLGLQDRRKRAPEVVGNVVLF